MTKPATTTGLRAIRSTACRCPQLSANCDGKGELMAENESTKDLNALTADEKLNLLLADMRDIKARLASLETFAEDRSRDTRPMLERIHQEVAEQGQTLHALRRDVGLLREDIFNERRERADLAARVAEIERRPGFSN